MTAPTLRQGALSAERSSLPQFFAYFLRLGTLGFGGPIALAGAMRRDLVEQRGWIDAVDYDEGLALAQLSPGPLAAQLAIYLGWVRARLFGALMVSIAFVAPSFFMVLAIGFVYLRFGAMPWMQGAFYGIAAAVSAIIIRSAVNLSKKTLKRDWLLWTIAAVNGVTTAVMQAELVWLVVLGGVVTLAATARAPKAALSVFPLPAAWLAGLKGPAATGILLKILTYFTTAGLFVFGSGLAIVPFLHGGVVVQNEWLTERQFLDAVAVAMITPGPVVITVAFIGHLVAGPLGALAAAIGVFLPCFCIVVLVAPHYRRVAGKGKIKTFVSGVTAGAIGAIAGAAVVLTRKSVVDWPTLLLAVATFGALSAKRKVPEPLIIFVAGAIGIGLRGASG